MSSGRLPATYPHSDKTYYRLGQKPEKKGWWRHSLGWFADAVFVLLSVGVVGFGWTARDAFMASMSAQFDSQTTPSVTQLSIAQPLVNQPKQANNIVTMQPVVADWVKNHQAQKWSIVVKSIDGPVIDAGYQSDVAYPSTDVYKLLIMLPLFNQVPVANQWQTTIKVDKSKYAVAKCVDLMLRQSDDACGTAVGNYLGWDKATKVLNDVGLKHTDLAHQGQPETSAADVSQFLQSFNVSMFDTKARTQIVTALQKRTNNVGISQGCPGCTYTAISGQNGGVIGDAAIVQYSRGSYVFVVFTNGGSYDQLEQLSGKVQQRIVDETR